MVFTKFQVVLYGHVVDMMGNLYCYVHMKKDLNDSPTRIDSKMDHLGSFQADSQPY